jgi:hypothetical protein
MRRVSKWHPSPSMVVSLIALVIAASGTAMAASKLVSGDRLIRKGSLSGNRLRSHTLSGRQINLAGLGAVPNAAHAATADNATNANHAVSADTATNATKADHANNADNATSASSATQADNANHANNADHTTLSDSATDAGNLGGLPPSAYQRTCQDGAVAATVYVKGSASFPSSYTSSAPPLQEQFNCTGGIVEVKRTGTGVYHVHFAGLDSGAQLIAVGNQSVTPLGAAITGGSLTFKLVFDSGVGTAYQVTLADKTGTAVDTEFSFALLLPQ